MQESGLPEASHLAGKDHNMGASKAQPANMQRLMQIKNMGNQAAMFNKSRPYTAAPNRPMPDLSAFKAPTTPETQMQMKMQMAELARAKQPPSLNPLPAPQGADQQNLMQMKMAMDNAMARRDALPQQPMGNPTASNDEIMQKMAQESALQQALMNRKQKAQGMSGALAANPNLARFVRF